MADLNQPFKANPDKAVHKDNYIYPFMTVVHEYNAYGSHRLIIINRHTRYGGRMESKWFGYHDIATIKLVGIPDYRWSAIAATTEYYGDTLPRCFHIEALERHDGN
jgi:hypothetical protein